MLCLRKLSEGPCPLRLQGGPRHWSCLAGHEWWGTDGGALSSTPWPADRPPWWRRLLRR